MFDAQRIRFQSMVHTVRHPISTIRFNRALKRGRADFEQFIQLLYKQPIPFTMPLLGSMRKMDALGYRPVDFATRKRGVVGIRLLKIFDDQDMGTQSILCLGNLPGGELFLLTRDNVWQLMINGAVAHTTRPVWE